MIHPGMLVHIHDTPSGHTSRTHPQETSRMHLRPGHTFRTHLQDPPPGCTSGQDTPSGRTSRTHLQDAPTKVSSTQSLVKTCEHLSNRSYLTSVICGVVRIARSTCIAPFLLGTGLWGIHMPLSLVGARWYKEK